MKNINNKKGVELALNTVVVSAIALIVLVVIILLKIIDKNQRAQIFLFL